MGPTSNELETPKSVHTLTALQDGEMEDLHCLRNILKKGDYMCKLELNDAYFSVPLNPASGKFL